MNTLYKTSLLSGMLLLVSLTFSASAFAQKTQIPGTRPSVTDARAATQTARPVLNQAAEADALVPFYTEAGLISVSIDGSGSNAPAGDTIRVDKPAGATVRQAFLLAASTPGATLSNGDVALDGAPIDFDEIITFEVFTTGNSGRADVTALVQPILDAAPAGLVDFIVTEPNASPLIDGEVLVVIFDDPNQTEPQTVSLAFGAQDPDGDTFSIALANPFDGAAQSLSMSLGISFGFQGGSDTQDSQIDVNGQRITSAAGGNDDGEDQNGALITVGGIGDSLSNPPDPLQRENGDARYDDERYTLDDFIEDGDTQITVDTQNPSNDDNVFFAAFVVAGNTAIVGEDILLTPTEAPGPVGEDHTVTALVQNNAGDPQEGVAVSFEVTSGPSAGLTGTGDTDDSGEATFTWTSAVAGTDVVTASFVNEADETITSNEATKEWIADDVEDETPPVCEGSLDEGAFSGSVTDDAAGDSGVISVALGDDSENLALIVDEFTPGDPTVSYEVVLDDPRMDGAGTVVGTDGAGLTCSTPVAIPGGDEPPPTDTTPPVCGSIEVERNDGGDLAAINTSASDAESGIAEVAFTTLQNLDGFAGEMGPYAQGDVATFDAEATERVSIRGERLDFSRGGAILTTVTNGAGLTATCDPVVEQLSAEVPQRFSLQGNAPNPFRTTTRVGFSLAEAAPVTLEVYDLLGRKVTTLMRGEQLSASTYEVAWDGRDAAGRAVESGVYFYRLEAGSFSATRRMTVVR